jgi:hypothetical protein
MLKVREGVVARDSRLIVVPVLLVYIAKIPYSSWDMRDPVARITDCDGRYSFSRSACCSVPILISLRDECEDNEVEKILLLSSCLFVS